MLHITYIVKTEHHVHSNHAGMTIRQNQSAPHLTWCKLYGPFDHIHTVVSHQLSKHTLINLQIRQLQQHCSEDYVVHCSHDSTGQLVTMLHDCCAPHSVGNQHYVAVQEHGPDLACQQQLHSLCDCYS